MKANATIAALIASAGLCSVASAQDQTVVISEIFAPTNQNFADGQSEVVIEFLEIYNYGTEPVDVFGWTIQDDGVTSPIPEDPATPGQRFLAPGEALVLFGGDGFSTANGVQADVDVADRATLETFDTCWGPGRNRVLLPIFESLSNSPSSTNEVLDLVDAGGNIVDTVNYDDSNDWPGDQPDGNSICMIAEALDLAFIAANTGGLDGFPAGSTPKTLNDSGYAWSRAELVIPGGLNGGPATAFSKVDGVVTSNNVFIDGVNFQSEDVNMNGVLDMGEDTNGNGIIDTFSIVVPGTDPNALLLIPNTNIASPGVIDLTIDGVDCNNNGVDDDVDLINGNLDPVTFLPFEDLNFGANSRDGIIDTCVSEDCDENDVIDPLEIGIDQANRDCNLNGILDVCEIADDPTLDQDGNGRLDACDVGDIIITEISYNTVLGGALENQSEWLEFTNVGDSAVNLDGWGFLKLDLGGDNGFESFEPFPAGLSIAPGESIVVITPFTDASLAGLDPVAEFQAAFGTGFQIIVTDESFFLANNGSAGNEILGIFAPPAGGASPDFVLVDTVDYDADNTNFPQNPDGLNWPIDGAFSIALRPPTALVNPGLDYNANPIPSFNAQQDLSISNNWGGNWESSFAGLNGAVYSTGAGEFRNTIREQASPGVYFQGPNQTDGSGEVIITEIFATSNTQPIPTGIFDGMTELLEFPQNEWVEILNTTGAPVDLSGWYLQDEDGRTTGISDGAILQPGEVAVIFGTDTFVGADFPAFEYECRELAADEFYKAWGGGYQVLAVEGWNFDRDVQPGSQSLRNLSDNPSSVNEVLTLRNAAGGLVDFLNWNDSGSSDGEWPTLATSNAAISPFSIFLTGPFTADGNNAGFNWFPHDLGIDVEARQATDTDFFGVDAENAIASPGIIPGGMALDLLDIPAFDGCPDENCNPADFAEPFGSLDIADVVAFLQAFGASDPSADLAAPMGTFDIADVVTFLQIFGAGCP